MGWIGVSIKLSGLDEMLTKVESAGNDVDEACKAAVNAAAPIVEKSMKDGAERHTKGHGKYGTGTVYNAIEAEPAKQVGNYVYANVGIDLEKHPEAVHAIYQEYGDGHSKQFPDPFIRPAFDTNKNAIRAAERMELKARGMPID